MSLDIENFTNFFDKKSLLHLNYKEQNDEEEPSSFSETSILIFLIDKSGSMSGNPFNLLKEAIIKLMPMVLPNFFKIHFIVFDNQAYDITYEKLINISANGGTSFDKAHLKLIEFINKYENTKSFQIIYFTDGLDGCIDFNIIKNFLNQTKKSITFNTCGFGSDHDVNLLTKLTQMSSTCGFYKSFKTSADINFDDFGNLFDKLKNGYILLNDDDSTKKFFTINKTNEDFLFHANETSSLKIRAFMNNRSIEINNYQVKTFDSITDYSFKIMIFNMYLAELFKLGDDKKIFIEKITLFIEYINEHLAKHVSIHNSILENEFVSDCFAEIITLCKTFIAQSKTDQEISKLKALAYDNILKSKFKKRLDQRAAKNELNFTNNYEKAKLLIEENKSIIETMDVSIFPDRCYMSQEHFNELILKKDCLGICFKMSRNGEVAIVNPNFVRINDIGYSSFISLNNVFNVLKYKLDITNDDAAILHGGFNNNLESFFLDGTHRAKYNAMLPLYINKFHWQIARLLLQPLFGYMFTLNISGYTSEQYYTLYFLVYEKIIQDMIEKQNSEAIERIYLQIKACCTDIYEQFKRKLEPNIDEFLLKHSNRTKDIITNMNSYLLYISLENNALEKVKKNKSDFDYYYFEEQARRQLKSNFKSVASIQFFTLNKLDIELAADQLVESDFKDEDSFEEMERKLNSNELIININNEKLFELLETKCGIKFDLSVESLIVKETSTLFENFLNKLKKFSFIKLYNYLFETNFDFCLEDSISQYAFVYQLINFGYTNENWRNHANYTKFTNSKEDSSAYLVKNYLVEFRGIFNRRYNEKVEQKKKTIKSVKVQKFLKSENFRLYSFIVGEKCFGEVINELIDEHNLTKIKHLIEKIFYVVFETPKYICSQRHKRFSIFKMIYLHEHLSKVAHEKSFEFLKKRHSENEPYAKYLYQMYSFLIDKEKLSKKDATLKDYIDYDLYVKFYINEKKNNLSLLTVNNQVKDKIKRIFHFDTYFSKDTASLSIDLKQLEIKWTREQFELKKKNILSDTEEWQKENDLLKLKRIGVLDITFDKNDNSTACAGILIFELDHNDNKLKIIYSNFINTKLTQPYISGLLAFREGEVYEKIINDVPAEFKPDCFVFDGNGILHKRECGLATHIGVKLNLVTFGVSKKMHFIENRFSYSTQTELTAYCKPLLKQKADFAELKTIDDNKILGYAYLSGSKATNPIFISPGNRISGETCLKVITLCNKYLENMGLDSRESIVSFIDKLSSIYLNDKQHFEHFIQHQFIKLI